MILIAPLSANTLAKLANGICDNLVVRKTALVLPLVLGYSTLVLLWALLDGYLMRVMRAVDAIGLRFSNISLFMEVKRGRRREEHLGLGTCFIEVGSR